MNIPTLHRFAQKHPGFTIVELLVVMAAVGILAAITIVAYTGVQQKAALSVMSSDLQNAAGAFKLARFESGIYPTDMPAELKTSSKVILSATQTAGDAFCINAYHEDYPTVKASWDSKKGLRENILCPGATIGQSAGGNVPITARDVNIAPDFSAWTYTGTATYNSSTGEVAMGTSGSARSPIIRVDSPRLMNVGADMYATTASPYASFQPQGGHHISIYYYGSDGTTPVMNSANYTSNGCAKVVALNSWQLGVKTCGFNGGENVIYISYLFWSSASGYTSPDMKFRKPLVTIVD